MPHCWLLQDAHLLSACTEKTTLLLNTHAACCRQDGSLTIEPDIDSGKTTYGVPNMWVTVQRVVASRERAGAKQYLVKWEGLGYDHCTWEAPADLTTFTAKIQELSLRVPLAGRQGKV